MHLLEIHMIFALGQLKIALQKIHHMRLNMRSDAQHRVHEVRVLLPSGIHLEYVNLNFFFSIGVALQHCVWFSPTSFVVFQSLDQ